MGDGAKSEVLDEGFFRRYRELLDAEDVAFDELEHAYEEGDRTTTTPTSLPGEPPSNAGWHSWSATSRRPLRPADHLVHEPHRHLHEAVGTAHEEMARARHHRGLRRDPTFDLRDH